MSHGESTGTTEDADSFGGALYALRQRLALPQSVVAARARISPGYYSELENSKRRAPPRSTALRLWRHCMHLDHTQTAATAAYLEASNGHSRLVALSLALGDENSSRTPALWSSDGGHCQLKASTPTTDCNTPSPCWSCVWFVGSGPL